jgi:hypothetical protein
MLFNADLLLFIKTPRWHRYEWRSRSSIHAQRFARLSNDPGLIKLTALVYIGRLAAKKLDNSTDLNASDKNKLFNDVQIGIESGNIVF